MTTLKLIIITALSIIVFNTNAQEQKATSPVQFSFIYPVGSNGQNALNKANNCSFNMLWGMNGGVKGFELGGIGNFNKGDVNGCQIAGITNITKGSITGAAISGIANIHSNDTKGLSLSGIANIHAGKTKGLMLSGIVNISNKNMSGAQISLVNNTYNDMDGFQLGLINYAKKLKGFQLGLINVTDSIDGIALGLISIYKDGYYAVEVSNSEVLHAHTSYKIGQAHFYNIYTVGYGRYQNNDVFSYGFGLGSLISLHKRHSLAIEGITNQMAYDDKWGKLNMLNKLNLTYQFHVTDRISLVGGPSLNFYISNHLVDGKYGTLNMPKTIWKHRGSSNMKAMWIGYNAGINIRL